jgi:hypothetical protein
MKRASFYEKPSEKAARENYTHDLWFLVRRCCEFFFCHFVCTMCGQRGANVRPDYDWDKDPVRQTGFRACRGH